MAQHKGMLNTLSNTKAFLKELLMIMTSTTSTLCPTASLSYYAVQRSLKQEGNQQKKD